MESKKETLARVAITAARSAIRLATGWAGGGCRSTPGIGPTFRVVLLVHDLELIVFGCR
jgi:hypothetical protein